VYSLKGKKNKGM